MNMDKLKGRVVEYRIQQEDLGKIIKLSSRSINRKLNGHSKFNQEEISKIKKLLNLTNDEVVEIFLD